MKSTYRSLWFFHGNLHLELDDLSNDNTNNTFIYSCFEWQAELDIPKITSKQRIHFTLAVLTRIYQL